jgi:hypothetical protein
MVVGIDRNNTNVALDAGGTDRTITTVSRDTNRIIPVSTISVLYYIA